MTEAEATGINFAIDHYRPKRSKPELENSYDNLMYCCSECNSRKGDRDPPAEAQSAGVRFFRPDQDARPEHFSLAELDLVAETPIGEYSIEAIDLNRAHLRRLRDIRKRFSECDEYISEGLAALFSFRIDRLRPEARVRALKTREKISKMVSELRENFDEILRDAARSELIDPDPEAEKRFRDRKDKLRDYESLYPGNWRARSVKRG